MTHRTDGGDAVIAAFTAAGADWIFSSPGSEWAPVWESLARRHRDGLPCPRYLDLTHETVAVGMAAGYALVTRRPQGVLLHAGPGLLQGSMAIHGALLAGVPMVVASSESSTYGDGPGPDPGGQWYRNLSVVGGPHTMAAPFTKWSNQAASVHTLTTMITRSAEMASRAPAGPVYLNIPLEVLLEEWAGPDPKPVVARGATVSAAGDVRAVLELLTAASNPVIVTETTGREEGGMAALVAFAEALRIPVVEPASAVCANFPRTHELHAGSEFAPDAHDVIVLLNCRAPFYPPSRKPATAKIVVIDEVPQRPHIAYQVLNADHYLEGGVVATLRELAAHAVPTRVAPIGTEREAVAAVERKTAGTLDPVQVAAALRTVPEAVVVDETITHSRVVQRHLQRDEPDSYFYVQGGLGQGIAVALGVKLAAPDRTVVLTIGDGAFLYNPIVQSLQASRANVLPLLIVVFNNHEYRSMKMNHLRFYPEGAAVSTGEFLGNDLADQPDLAALAAPFAMHAETVETPDELAPALARAVKSVRGGTTAIVNVHVSR
ncbi:benzoylformate decarboxylase [Actinoplanes sichuanensis]|uniref:Thiamine pyrophosphate-dependent enzyme n=1 Tax=Actinoplanes sichuanensis TaxID=512349 RepID=A0ABW4AHT4_9ACTN|nr:thiamine pyrophosphate-dependent enzyme [Actinoplanes sichuanensis]BEL02447.1 benzoylformate decarboxylase [Actinoplanes sichuanensis]